MNGHRIPGTPIVVDFWRIRQCARESIFFLSHAHADHCQGLTSSWSDPIYTSELTAKIATHRCKVPSKVFRTLEIGCPHLIEQLDGGTFTVTLIDANHCPGSVMFVFEGQFGIIMYTGDFRYSSDMLQDTLLTSYRGKIDKLYLDNTYCAPAFDFPLREEMALQIIAVIAANPESEVTIGIRGLGKEDLLEEIALELKAYVVVSPSRHLLLSIMGCTDVFVIAEPDCKCIKTVPFHHITQHKVRIWSRSRPSLFILPTALFIGQKTNPFSEFDNVFVVPYSDHSSYSELHQFVRMLKPKLVIPIVFGKNGTHNGHVINDMSCFSMYLTPSSTQTFPTFYNPLNVNVERRPSSNAESRKRKRCSTNKRRSLRTPIRSGTRGVVFESSSSASESEHCEVSIDDTRQEDSSVISRYFSVPKQKLSNGTGVRVPDSSKSGTIESPPTNNGASHCTAMEMSPDMDVDECSSDVRNNIEATTNGVIDGIDGNKQCGEKEVCQNNDRLSPDLFIGTVIETVAAQDVHMENVEGHCEDVMMECNNNNSSSINHCTCPSEQPQEIQSSDDVLEIISQCSDISLPSTTSTLKSKTIPQDAEEVGTYDIYWKMHQDKIEKILKLTSSQKQFAYLHTHFRQKPEWLPRAKCPVD